MWVCGCEGVRVCGGPSTISKPHRKEQTTDSYPQDFKHPRNYTYLQVVNCLSITRATLLESCRKMYLYSRDENSSWPLCIATQNFITIVSICTDGQSKFQLGQLNSKRKGKHTHTLACISMLMKLSQL